MKASISNIQAKVESIINNRNGRGYASLESDEKHDDYLLAHYVPNERHLINDDFEALKSAGFSDLEKNSMRIHIICEYDKTSPVGFAKYTA